MTLREAKFGDISDLTELINQLGYPTTHEEMFERFSHIQKLDDYKTFVAVSENKVIGVIGMIKNFFYEHNGFYIRIAVLVVNKEYRQKGIGKKLLQYSENFALHLGAEKLLVNSGNREERIAAHAFYENMGFEAKSTGFVKNI